MNENEPIIVCRDVWKVFGPISGKVEETIRHLRESNLTKEEALSEFGLVIGVKEANFEIRAGEVFVIMGLSGSGKSTLLRCFNRLIEPTWGRIEVEGQDVGQMTKKELRKLCQDTMSMVFQHFALIPSRNVLENVCLGLEVKGLPRDNRIAKAREALELVGMSGWEKQTPSELSGGMQQRVGLARALAVDPHILLMDEPFSALDPLIRKQIQDEFLKLVKIVNKTILFITHDLDEAIKIGDRIAVMKGGKIAQIGTPEDIIMRPEDEYVAEFVGAISRSKRETARNIMVEDTNWFFQLGDNPADILEKMRKDMYPALFCLNEDEQILGVLEYKTLRETLEDEDTTFDLSRLLSDDYIVVDANAGMDEILVESAKTKIPLVVLDKKLRMDGIIPRSQLLRELAEMI